jgi:hypothetical protein
MDSYRWQLRQKGRGDGKAHSQTASTGGWEKGQANTRPWIQTRRLTNGQSGRQARRQAGTQAGRFCLIRTYTCHPCRRRVHFSRHPDIDTDTHNTIYVEICFTRESIPPFVKICNLPYAGMKCQAHLDLVISDTNSRLCCGLGT